MSSWPIPGFPVDFFFAVIILVSSLLHQAQVSSGIVGCAAHVLLIVFGCRLSGARCPGPRHPRVTLREMLRPCCSMGPWFWAEHQTAKLGEQMNSVAASRTFWCQKQYNTCATPRPDILASSCLARLFACRAYHHPGIILPIPEPRTIILASS